MLIALIPNFGYEKIALIEIVKHEEGKGICANIAKPPVPHRGLEVFL